MSPRVSSTLPSPSIVRSKIATWQIYDKPLSITARISLNQLWDLFFRWLTGSNRCYEGAKTEEGGGMVVLRWFAPNWNEMAESQKEIHSRPLQLRWRLVSRNDFASRAEIFVPSTTAMRCPTSLFFHASHCFCPLWRADQRRNIYPLVRGF